MSEYVPVLGIAIVCYMVGEFIKKFDNKKLNKFIPTIVGTLGAILGLIIFFTDCSILGDVSWLDSLSIGIVSGLASTGANQIVKQLGE